MAGMPLAVTQEDCLVIASFSVYVMSPSNSCDVPFCGVLLWCPFVVTFCGIPKMMSLPVSLIFSSCGISKDTTRGYHCGVLDDVTSCPQAHKHMS